MWLLVIFTIPHILFVSTTFNVIHSYCYILVMLAAKVDVESKTFYNRNSFTVSNNDNKKILRGYQRPYIDNAMTIKGHNANKSTKHSLH